MNKRRKKFLNELLNNYSDPNNIYPKGISDEKALKILTDYFLGEGYYIADPLSHNQANTIIVKEIISNN